jgi:hypothetical protein
VSHPVYAADGRECLCAGIVRTAGQLLVNRFQRCGMNMYDYLAFARNWLRERFTSRRLPQRV